MLRIKDEGKRINVLFQCVFLTRRKEELPFHVIFIRAARAQMNERPKEETRPSHGGY